ncbi:MAG: transposase [Methanopyri archaeon]|nr:transposase [Methanopyri archaeon]
MKRAFVFKVYPTKEQTSQLERTLETCRILYNDLLSERKTTYEVTGKGISYFEQQHNLVKMKKVNYHLAQVNAQVLQDVARRIKRSFDGFFRRVKNGETPGYPRFKGRGWYKSFTYPQHKKSFRIKRGRLSLSKIGAVRMFQHRPIEGILKTCTLKRDDVGDWFAIIVSELPDVPKSTIEETVGVDVGLKNLAVPSNGLIIKPPAFLRELEKKLAKLQRRLDRKKKGSKNREMARVKVAACHRKIARQRRDYLHKASRSLVDSANRIVFENLNIDGMLKNHHLAKSIADASWGTLVQFTMSKAESAGKSVELVPSRNTSQLCSKCGAFVRKALSVRTHKCLECGLVMDRDLNAAINIRDKFTLGQRGRACGVVSVGRGCEAGSPMYNHWEDAT